MSSILSSRFRCALCWNELFEIRLERGFRGIGDCPKYSSNVLQITEEFEAQA
jgi:hypothetical protein